MTTGELAGGEDDNGVGLATTLGDGVLTVGGVEGAPPGVAAGALANTTTTSFLPSMHLCFFPLMK